MRRFRQQRWQGQLVTTEKALPPGGFGLFLLCLPALGEPPPCRGNTEAARGRGSRGETAGQPVSVWSWRWVPPPPARPQVPAALADTLADAPG